MGPSPILAVVLLHLILKGLFWLFLILIPFGIFFLWGFTL